MRRANPKSSGGTLRIVAGSLRGSRLEVPDLDGLRPTPDRVRETLFNWLAPVIAGARCLDLYAGTGALGIEALSRGAGECVFIERDRALCVRLQDNLARLRVANARVVNADACGFLAAAPAAAFDLTFLDPPFGADLWAASAQALEQGGWLRPGAFIYLEAPKDAAPPLPANWAVHREGHAGAVRYALYHRLA
ncbi:16S rRNA (guanine(966)-N(2))-methyltransferase [Dokdonella soli]|uniref:Ribosomal RNA small subunit methyltransferase D n=2 Tax=Dokdonella soli TaxID=529810 RepID=A0ABN1IX75_9GAMM